MGLLWSAQPAPSTRPLTTFALPPPGVLLSGPRPPLSQCCGRPASSTIMITEDAGRPQHWLKGGRGPDNSTPGGGNANVVNGRVDGAGWADHSSPIPLHGFNYQ